MNTVTGAPPKRLSQSAGSSSSGEAWKSAVRVERAVEEPTTQHPPELLEMPLLESCLPAELKTFGPPHGYLPRVVLSLHDGRLTGETQDVC